MKKSFTRREIVSTSGKLGVAAALAGVSMPAIAQTKKKQLVFASLAAPPEGTAVAYSRFCDEVTKRSGGELEVAFHGGTLITKEMEMMNGLKAGNVHIGHPGGAASNFLPNFDALQLPYIVRDYDHAGTILNGPVGKQLTSEFEKTSGLKLLFYHDIGFRHFFNSKRPINVPADLRGLKLRSIPNKISVDSLNLFGANAVPISFSEMMSAAQTGVIDGGDLPIVNMINTRIWEVSKYASLTFHTYNAMYVAMNLDAWNSLTPAQQKLMVDVGAETQTQYRAELAKVDNLDAAKAALVPKGMAVNAADLAAFRAAAQEKIWPRYQAQFGSVLEQLAKA
jgi:TRAP-type transport system periplasmic protein